MFPLGAVRSAGCLPSLARRHACWRNAYDCEFHAKLNRGHHLFEASMGMRGVALSGVEWRAPPATPGRCSWSRRRGGTSPSPRPTARRSGGARAARRATPRRRAGRRLVSASIQLSMTGRRSSVKRGCRGAGDDCGRRRSGAAAAGRGRARRRGSSGDGLRRRTFARRWRPEERGCGEASESESDIWTAMRRVRRAGINRVRLADGRDAPRRVVGPIREATNVSSRNYWVDLARRP